MYTYMEDALDYLTDYASKHHIRIMWASLSPITPPGSNFEYRSVVMNSNWHNPKEFIFQLAHEISHVIHVKGVNTLNIEVTIEGNKQTIQLFLAGDVNG